MLCANPTLYWIAALSTTPTNKEESTIHKPAHYSEFPHGLEAQKVAVEIEAGRNLHSPFSTLILTEKNETEMGTWTKIYFFGYMSLGTMIFASGFPGL